MLAPLLLALVVGYFCGAIPNGYLVARARGVNIFEVGSRSPGATNVRRVLGAGAGNLVYVLDALKGIAATGWPLLAMTWVAARAGAVQPPFDPRHFGELLGLVGLAGALVGHSFSCFTQFRGGKGVATASGGMLVLMPFGTLAAAVVWVLAFYLSRYVSLASLLSAVALPIAAVGLNGSRALILVSSLVAAFVIIRHRANIARLASGTENRFERRK